MIEKLQEKINTEINKVLEKQDFTLEDIKTMIDIKNGLEMKDFLKESLDKGFSPIEFEGGEIQ